MATLNKPGSDLEWCNNNPVDGTSGQPAIIDPSGGKKDSGFLRLEKPPRQDMNWFMNTAGLWNSYLETFTDGAPILNAAHYNLDPGNTGVQNITALNTVLALGKKVFIPAGTYDVEGNPTIPDGSHIVGIPKSVIIRSSGITDWDIKDKRVNFFGINFEDNGPDIKILCGHSSDDGYSLFDSCSFEPTAASGTAILDLTPGAVNDSSGLLHIINCYFNRGEALTNLDTETACPRIIATGNDFDNSEIILRSSSIAVRIFRGNRFITPEIRLGGGGIFIENNFFDNNSGFLHLQGTTSGRFANNDGANLPTVAPSGSNRFEFENNRDENGIMDDQSETIEGVRYYGENGGLLLADTTSTKINFDLNRTVQMARDSTYTKDIVEDGTGTFTIKGISKEQTRIQCTLVFPTTVPTGDFEAYLKVNGTNRYVFNKSLFGAAGSVLNLNQTLLFAKADTFHIEVRNDTGGNIQGFQTSNDIDSHIVVDGF